MRLFFETIINKNKKLAIVTEFEWFIVNYINVLGEKSN